MSGKATRQDRARVRAIGLLRNLFGPISDRDAAIFSAGMGLGYRKGYSAKKSARKRQAKIPVSDAKP